MNIRTDNTVTSAEETARRNFQLASAGTNIYFIVWSSYAVVGKASVATEETEEVLEG